LARDFISKISSINAGYHVVQGHRAAKNTKDFAMLDAISEESVTISIVKDIAPLVCLLD
jgi:hypothetical protein